MSDTITYSDLEKAAIISLLLEMANVDDDIAVEELNEINLINDELNITYEIFNHGKATDINYAIKRVSIMPEKKKLEVGSYLTRIIDADKIVKDVEIKLLNEICHRTGIDIIINKKIK